jgi:hypothetical protein
MVYSITYTFFAVNESNAILNSYHLQMSVLFSAFKLLFEIMIWEEIATSLFIEALNKI